MFTIVNNVAVWYYAILFGYRIGCLFMMSCWLELTIDMYQTGNS